MKDYTFKNDDKSLFIKKVKFSKDGEVMTVKYANGIVETVPATDENIAIAERLQENQAKKAVRRIGRYEVQRNNAVNKGFTLATLSGLATGMIANVVSDDPIVIGSTAGAIAIATAIPNIIKFVQNTSKVKELKKIEALNEHKEQLERVDEYNDVLQGTSKKARSLFETAENPTSILYIDSYTEEDIDKIIENMTRENTIGFDYGKAK